MTHLLDINVLIALCDPAHPSAADARQFYRNTLARGEWATCPLVENGFLRIFGNRNYPGGPGSPDSARIIFNGLRQKTPGHHFWQDDLSLLDSATFPNLPGSADLTDIYLLALAVKNGGRFATFDRSFDPSMIRGGEKALLLLQA